MERAKLLFDRVRQAGRLSNEAKVLTEYVLLLLCLSILNIYFMYVHFMYVCICMGSFWS